MLVGPLKHEVSSLRLFYVIITLKTAGFERLCLESWPVSWKISECRSRRENSRQLRVQKHEAEQDVQLLSGSGRVHGPEEIRVSQER